MVLTNEAHTFKADEDGNVLTGQYAGGGTSIQVYEGSQLLGFDATPTNGQYSVTASGNNITPDGTPNSAVTGIVTYSDPSEMTSDNASITFTIIGKRLDGTDFTQEIKQSFSKAFSGSNARLLKLVTSGLTFTKPATSQILDPEAIEISTEHNNLPGETVTFSTTPAVDLYTASTGGDVTISALTGETVYLRRSDFKDLTQPLIITASTSPLGRGTFTDKVTIVKLEEGSSAIQAILSNEAHTYQSDQAGTIAAPHYSTGTTSIVVYEGTDLLNVGTGDGEYEVTLDSAENITAGSITTQGSSTVLTGTPSNMTSTGASLVFTIAGKRKDGTAFSFKKVQSFSKSIAGQDAYSIELNQTSYSVEENTDGSLNPFSTTITGKIFKGSVDKTSNYVISAVEVYDQNGVANKEAFLGLESFTATADTSLTVTTLTTSFARLELSFSDTSDEGGPTLVKSIVFSRQKTGRQGPGVLYIGDFSDLATTRLLNNNDNARDVVSHGGNFYAYVGEDAAEVSAVGAPASDKWEAFTYFSAIATGTLITEESYIKNTLNIGTNAAGDAANITFYGANSVNPYMSIGQVSGSLGFGKEGIFLGVDSGTAKISLSDSGGTNSLS